MDCNPLCQNLSSVAAVSGMLHIQTLCFAFIFHSVHDYALFSSVCFMYFSSQLPSVSCQEISSFFYSFH